MHGQHDLGLPREAAVVSGVQAAAPPRHSLHSLARPPDNGAGGMHAPDVRCVVPMGTCLQKGLQGNLPLQRTTHLSCAAPSKHPSTPTSVTAPGTGTWPSGCGSQPQRAAVRQTAMPDATRHCSAGTCPDLLGPSDPGPCSHPIQQAAWSVSVQPFLLALRADFLPDHRAWLTRHCC